MHLGGLFQPPNRESGPSAEAESSADQGCLFTEQVCTPSLKISALKLILAFGETLY